MALDGNPFTTEPSYKQIIIDQLVHLRQLDLKKITDDERRMASIVVRKEEEKRRESSKVCVLATCIFHNIYYRHVFITRYTYTIFATLKRIKGCNINADEEVLMMLLRK